MQSPAIAPKPTRSGGHADASTHPVDILLTIDRDNAPRAAKLREEAVKAIERANVKHATTYETIRAQHRKAVAVVAGDPRRVNPGRKREGVKPKRNRIAHPLGVPGGRVDRVHVGDEPLGSGRLRDRLDRLAPDCMGCQRTNSSLSFTWRSHQHYSLARAAPDGLTA